MESNNSKIPSVSELLAQDLNDEIVIMRLMSHPNPELVIAGLIRMIKEERSKFSEQIESIYKRISTLESRTKTITNDVGSVNRIVDFMKNKKSKQNDDNEIIDVEVTETIEKE